MTNTTTTNIQIFLEGTGAIFIQTYPTKLRSVDFYHERILPHNVCPGDNCQPSRTHVYILNLS